MKRSHHHTARPLSSSAARTLGLTALAILALLAPPQARAQGHPNVSVGLSPESAYDVGQIDNVSLFNGSLSMAFPVGPRYPVSSTLSYGFTLVYNSNVWDYVEREYEGEIYTEAVASRQFNAGLGWLLTLGELWHPGYVYNHSGEWIYLSPDGGAHVFHQQLHRDENDGDDGTLYTRDGAYIRMRSAGANWKWIDTPDGLVRTFVKTGGRFRLTKIQDRFGNWVQIDYNADDTVWTITDSQGRSHTVTLQEMTWIGKQVQSISFAGPGGTQLVWDFDYWEQHRARSCKDTYPLNSTRILLPLLIRLTRPDGSKFEMLDAGQPAYWDECIDGMYDRPGMISKLTLPTKGSIQWWYQRYDFPGGPLDYYNSATGVKRRDLYDRDGSLIGTWRYTTWRDTTNNEMQTHVRQPTGDCTKHFFAADPSTSTNPYRGWEYGLPFTWRFESGGKYLSSQVFPSHDGTFCTGGAIRSTYVWFEHDKLDPSPSSPGDWYASNRRMTGSRTIFHDDGGRYVDSSFSDFDGVGHFRTVTTTSDFPDGSNARTVTTDFNPARGTYAVNPHWNGYKPEHDYVPIAPGEPWILGTFVSSEVSEPGALGNTVAKSEFSFDPATGALQCQRILAAGTSRSGGDLVTILTRNGAGNVTSSTTYGGDLAPVGTGSVCATGSAGYGADMTYSSGVLATVRPRGTDGSLLPYLTYDATIDPSTGWATATRGPSGLQTTYTHDSLGRVTSVTPAEGPSTSVTYNTASGAAPASVHTTVSAGFETLAESEVIFDGIGRVVERRSLHPDAGWASSTTTYNARGWVLSRTIPGGGVVQYLGHDVFGRPSTIRPPDGSTHDVLLDYDGVRRVVRQTKVGTTAGETYVAHESVADAFGRLVRVSEPATAAANHLTGAYSYDVAGRLTRVLLTAADSGLTQERLFTYDNRGFLLSETHPELGAAGGGTTTYSGFDAAGNVSEMSDGTRHLRYVYDVFGRLAEVRDAANADRLIQELAYDTATGRGEGKLATALQHNYVDIPGEGPQDVTVSESFAYAGVAGLLSSRTTQISRGGLQFTEQYGYDAAGQLTGLTYPACEHAGCGTSIPARTVTASYELGFLRSIDGFAGPISYHASGAWSALPHANGVTDHLDLDASGIPRIGRIYTTGSADDWDSGLYRYDGSGNILEIGTDAYVYDAVGRLAGTGELTGGSWNPDLLWEAGTWTGVTNNASHNSWNADFDAPPRLVADMQTILGDDPAALRVESVAQDGARPFVEEEQSKTTETTHGDETVGYLAVADRPFPPNVPVEVGSVSVTHAWTSVTFTQQFTDPIVVAGPPSYNGTHAIVVRIRNVTSTGFDLRVEEWPYLDGSHTNETVYWLAVERGRWTLPEGTEVEAGSLSLSAPPIQGDETLPTFSPVSFSSAFGSVPVVFTAVATTNEAEAVTSRNRNVTTSGFETGLQEQELSVDGHAAETVMWIAWEPGIGNETGPVIDYEWEYGYDAFGNLTSHTQHFPDGTEQTRTFAILEASNRLSTGTYDTSGNLLSWGGGGYTYDAVGNLQSVGTTWIHLYSAGGERIGTIHNPGGGLPLSETYTLRTAGGQVIREVARASNMPAGELNWIRDYVWRGGGLLAAIDPTVSGEEVWHYTLDHLGSPRLVTDATGQVLARHLYSPFGEEMTDPADPEQAAFRMRFTGHERDLMASGSLDDLDYMHARSYSPHMGRFLQVDPVLGSAGSPQSWNRYGYVLNSPTNLADPSGRAPKMSGSVCNTSSPEWDCNFYYSVPAGMPPGETPDLHNLVNSTWNNMIGRYGGIDDAQRRENRANGLCYVAPYLPECQQSPETADPCASGTGECEDPGSGNDPTGQDPTACKDKLPTFPILEALGDEDLKPVADAGALEAWAAAAGLGLMAGAELGAGAAAKGALDVGRSFWGRASATITYNSTDFMLNFGHSYLAGREGQILLAEPGASPAGRLGAIVGAAVGVCEAAKTGAGL